MSPSATRRALSVSFSSGALVVFAIRRKTENAASPVCAPTNIRPRWANME